MKMWHLLIEGYCDGTKGQGKDFCENNLNIGVHCLQCSHFSYSKCPNEIAVTNSEGVVEYQEDFIGFGGDMEPVNIKKRNDYISVWKDVCRKKINEAYEEYISHIFHENLWWEKYMISWNQ